MPLLLEGKDGALMGEALQALQPSASGDGVHGHSNRPGRSKSQQPQQLLPVENEGKEGQQGQRKAARLSSSLLHACRQQAYQIQIMEVCDALRQFEPVL